MVIYKRIPYQNGEVTGFRYLKNSRLTKERTVPHDVMEKFTYTDTVEYDDKPDERRCKFCDAPQSRKKYYWRRGEKQPMIIELCDWHYHNLNLGKIAQLIREMETEAAEKAKRDAEKPVKSFKKGKKKWQEKVGAKASTVERVTVHSQGSQTTPVAASQARSNQATPSVAKALDSLAR